MTSSEKKKKKLYSQTSVSQFFQSAPKTKKTEEGEERKGIDDDDGVFLKGRKSSMDSKISANASSAVLFEKKDDASPPQFSVDPSKIEACDAATRGPKVDGSVRLVEKMMDVDEDDERDENMPIVRKRKRAPARANTRATKKMQDVQKRRSR